jgi:catechol-2,3-dioxygenase
LHGKKASQETIKSHVAAVCLWTENVPETAEFYMELLGLQEQPVKKLDLIRLRLNGAVLFILKGKPCPAKSKEPFPMFALTVEDLDEAIIFLKRPQY